MAEARRAAVWSPEALDDREMIWDYYVQVAGTHTAEKLLRGIAEVIALIEDHPFAGRARNEVRPGLRSFAATPSRHAGNRARAGWTAGYRREMCGAGRGVTTRSPVE